MHKTLRKRVQYPFSWCGGGWTRGDFNKKYQHIDQQHLPFFNKKTEETYIFKISSEFLPFLVPQKN